MARTGIGVVGCGDISGAYLTALRMFDFVEVVACASRTLEHARRKAAEFEVPRACTVNELMADPGVSIVLNLTVPAAHAEIARQALAAGKSVYNEKPFTTTRAEARELLAQAEERGLRVGCAPDTFLGAGLQTCRQLIDEGAIGRVVGATAFMLNHGHEHWHPAPEFYYRAGGGPMFDMGPYYLTALVALLGPVRRVSGAARITFPERTITSAPRRGVRIPVQVPTHVAAILEFGDGPVATLVTSFDVWSHNTPLLEVYGSEGTLSLPDPNTFGGPVRLRRTGDEAFREVEITRPYAHNSRGIGVADMADAIAGGRLHRCSAALAYHVLDCMHAIHDSAAGGRRIELESACERPEPLAPGVPQGRLQPGR